MTPPQTGPGQTHLVRAIGRWTLTALAVNSVIGSGIFGLPSTVAGYLGTRSTLAVLIAGAAIGIIMACFAEVSSRFAEAGGPYLYARTAFGRLIGILVGWTLYLAQTAAPAANANLFVIYLAEFWPRAKEPWPRFIILTALVWVLALINARGAKQGAVVSNVFTVAKILPLLMVILAGAALTLFHPAPWIEPSSYSSSMWMKAIFLLVFAYGGFESALAPTGESKNPARDMAFALFVTLHRLHSNLCSGAVGGGWSVGAVRCERPSACRSGSHHDGESRGAAGGDRRARVSLWIRQRKIAGDAAGYVCARRRGRSAPDICCRESEVPHALVLDSDLCERRVGAGPGGKLRLECNAFSGGTPLLLWAWFARR